ncbi:MAG: polynucleotide adenylyltransferase PcnB [Rectinemataceae bacterium]
MFIRYRRSEDGSPVAKAFVYTQSEHGIDPKGVDPDAVRIVERLKANGHQAYIVGGAVRDLLLGRLPKDFDLVTDAHPSRIKRLFRNARIIGKRFRLVHLYVGGRIYELSTFRSIANGTVGNEFGTIDEDALRRDFTFNALYYDPTDRTLVDYIGGFKDIRARKVKPVIPLKTIFKEDPVRMVRGVKYAAVSGFSVPFSLRLAIRRDAPLLGDTSSSRRTEEFIKILASGKSAIIVKALSEYKLFGYLAPAAWKAMQSDASYSKDLYRDLETLDAMPDALAPASAGTADLDSAVAVTDEAGYQAGERRISVLLTHYLKAFLNRLPEGLRESAESYSGALQASRDFLAPLNLPRIELEAAVLAIFEDAGLSPFRKGRPAPERTRSRRGGIRRRAGKNGSGPADGEPDNTGGVIGTARMTGMAAGQPSVGAFRPDTFRPDASSADVPDSPPADRPKPRKRTRRRKPRPADGSPMTGDAGPMPAIDVPKVVSKTVSKTVSKDPEQPSMKETHRGEPDGAGRP